MVDAPGVARGRPIGDARGSVSKRNGVRLLVGRMSIHVWPWGTSRACPLFKVVQSRDVKVALAGVLQRGRGRRLAPRGNGEAAPLEVRRVHPHMVHVMKARLDIVDPIRVQATDVIEGGVVHDLKDELFGFVLGSVLSEPLVATTRPTAIEADQDDPEFDVLPRIEESLVQDLCLIVTVVDGPEINGLATAQLFHEGGQIVGVDLVTAQHVEYASGVEAELRGVPCRR
mmetsp:Transcript_83348/g.223480  ORF Transcript_83348/g.223480 Transcript_83348/m.223480 type:complete len:228 (+) Transcript_83348:372-1055(+)